MARIKKKKIKWRMKKDKVLIIEVRKMRELDDP